MLVKECEDAGVRLEMETSVDNLIHRDGLYHLNTSRGAATSESLVIATGGLSIPKIGATKFGYEIARQFELDVLPTRPALVPLTFQSTLLERCKALSGLAVDAVVSCGKVTLGGVNTNELSSKTMEAKKQPHLYFIGEVVDVTGHLGGFNFQWAWSSGYVCGQYA